MLMEHLLSPSTSGIEHILISHPSFNLGLGWRINSYADSFSNSTLPFTFILLMAFELPKSIFHILKYILLLISKILIYKYIYLPLK